MEPNTHKGKGLRRNSNTVRNFYPSHGPRLVTLNPPTSPAVGAEAARLWTRLNRLIVATAWQEGRHCASYEQCPEDRGTRWLTDLLFTALTGRPFLTPEADGFTRGMGEDTPPELSGTCASCRGPCHEDNPLCDDCNRCPCCGDALPLSFDADLCTDCATAINRGDMIHPAT